MNARDGEQRGHLDPCRGSGSRAPASAAGARLAARGWPRGRIAPALGETCRPGACSVRARLLLVMAGFSVAPAALVAIVVIVAFQALG